MEIVARHARQWDDRYTLNKEAVNVAEQVIKVRRPDVVPITYGCVNQRASAADKAHVACESSAARTSMQACTHHGFYLCSQCCRFGVSTNRG